MRVAQAAPCCEGLHSGVPLDELTLGGSMLWMQSWPWHEDCMLPNPVSTRSCIDP